MHITEEMFFNGKTEKGFHNKSPRLYREKETDE